MDIERLAGTRLGNYEIESLLGQGGMGVVYKARQVNLDRPVALKILPPHLSSNVSFLKRFKREARAVAKLSHSNIIQIFDIAEDNDLHFFSMEYVEGETLDKVLEKKGKFEPKEAVRVISQVALALEHAHKHNIIHRDVKPSNIIIDGSGNAKVMDFGLARAADDRSKVTQSGTLIGTLGYMSPEQCRGEELDFRTDIYSLGVVLYEMLTGKPPFDAPNEVAMIHKIVSEEPPGVREFTADISEELNTVVSRAMAKDRMARHGNMTEFMESLRKLPVSSSSEKHIEEESSPSIVVLPFVDMSSSRDQEYLCDGMAEALINALTQIKDLKVVARTSAFSFKGQSLDVRDIGKRLNVATVLEGSIQKAGNRLRITGQLVNVADGYHLWSEKYDRNMDDIFAIQDEISEAIVTKLKPTLLKSEKSKLGARQAVPIETYDLYLKGRYFFNKSSVEALKKAVDYFEQALAIDPDYAQAYAGLADAHLVLPFFSSSRPQETYQKGRRAALRALEIDNTLAEAHISLGTVKSAYDWDWKGAERELKQAIELNPGYAIAHWTYAYHLVRVNRLDEAIAEIEEAHKLDSLSLQINIGLGMILYWAGQNDRAIEVLRKTIELDPNHPYAHLALGLAYLQKSMNDEALLEFEREREVSGVLDAAAEWSIAVWHALVGKREKALDILNTFLTRSETEYVPPTFTGLLYFALGDIDRGFEWLEKACESGDIWLGYFQAAPMVAPLRSDPRFKAILKKMGLEP